MEKLAIFLVTSGTQAENAARSLAYWQAHHTMVVFEHRCGTKGPHGGYAVVQKELATNFEIIMRHEWQQINPEELALPHPEDPAWRPRPEEK